MKYRLFLPLLMCVLFLSPALARADHVIASRVKLSGFDLFAGVHFYGNIYANEALVCRSDPWGNLWTEGIISASGHISVWYQRYPVQVELRGGFPGCNTPRDVFTNPRAAMPYHMILGGFARFSGQTISLNGQWRSTLSVDAAGNMPRGHRVRFSHW